LVASKGESRTTLWEFRKARRHLCGTQDWVVSCLHSFVWRTKPHLILRPEHLWHLQQPTCCWSASQSSESTSQWVEKWVLRVRLALFFLLQGCCCDSPTPLLLAAYCTVGIVLAVKGYVYFWIFLFSVCFQYLYSSSSGACPLGNDANFFFRRKMELLTFWLFHQPCANIQTWVLPIEKYLNYGSLCSKSLGVGKELTPHPWAEQCWLTGKLHLQSPGVNTGSLNPVLWKQLGPMFTLNTVLFFPLFRACCFQAHMASVLSAFCLVSVSSWQGYCHRHSLFAWLYFYVGEITSSACFAARCWDSWCGCSSVDVFQGILFFVTIILVLGCWCKGGGEGWMGWSALSAFSSWCPLFLPVPPRIWKKKIRNNWLMLFRCFQFLKLPKSK